MDKKSNAFANLKPGQRDMAEQVLSAIDGEFPPNLKGDPRYKVIVVLGAVKGFTEWRALGQGALVREATGFANGIADNTASSMAKKGLIERRKRGSVYESRFVLDDDLRQVLQAVRAARSDDGIKPEPADGPTEPDDTPEAPAGEEPETGTIEPPPATKLDELAETEIDPDDDAAMRRLFEGERISSELMIHDLGVKLARAERLLVDAGVRDVITTTGGDPRIIAGIIATLVSRYPR